MTNLYLPPDARIVISDALTHIRNALTTLDRWNTTLPRHERYRASLAAAIAEQILAEYLDDAHTLETLTPDPYAHTPA